MLDISIPSWQELTGENNSFRRGAVMVPLVMTERGTRLLLILRPDSMRLHGGQVAFPGGSMDQGDRSPWDTACRETYEEVGIFPDQVEYVSLLPPENVLVSNFRVYPIVAKVKGVWTLDDFNPNPSEVARIYLWNMASFSKEPEIRKGLYKGTPYEFPVYPLKDGVSVWGATARILRCLLSMYSPSWIGEIN